MNVLHINSSLFSDAGKSSELGQHFVDQWKSQNPTSTVTTRDLAKEPVPHLDADTFQAAGTAPNERSDAQKNQAALADTLIEELQNSDVLVLSVPMYNFGIPSTLKAWIDHIARAGTTFKYTPNGPQGLLTGKKAYVLAARGGAYQGTPNDTQTPYLTTLLNFVGITDIHFVYAEKLAMDADNAHNIMAQAKAEIDGLLQQ